MPNLRNRVRGPAPRLYRYRSGFYRTGGTAASCEAPEPVNMLDMARKSRPPTTHTNGAATANINNQASITPHLPKSNRSTRIGSFVLSTVTTCKLSRRQERTLKYTPTAAAQPGSYGTRGCALTGLRETKSCSPRDRHEIAARSARKHFSRKWTELFESCSRIDIPVPDLLGSAVQAVGC